MKTLRVLAITFKSELEPWEVSAFRAAIIEIAGREYTLFHNHEDDNYLYEYPRIQYKRIGKKAAIVCLEEGIDELHHFFNRKGRVALIGDREIELEVERVKLYPFQFRLIPHQLRYKIKNWVALNEENYKKFRISNDIEQNLDMLSKILTGNIISMAKSIDWTIDGMIQTHIKQLSFPKIVKIKNTKMTTFDADFETNVALPAYIGLGKSVSKGFGVVLPQNEKKFTDI
ncbi:MAG: CRISPR-associated endonuclease Cas6 [Bacteroidales bacterium]